jgi:probable HAF family extracellular repeat protein
MTLNYRSSTLLAALVCTSAACGDDGGTQHDTPDAGGGDASVEPLKPGIAMLTDLERAVDVTSNGRTVLFWKQSNGELYFYDVASGQLEVKTTLDPAGLETEQPHEMSDVGHIVAGYGAMPEAPSRWDASNGWLKLNSPIGPCHVDPDNLSLTATGSAHGISADGKAVVGLLWDASCKNQAFLWKDTGGDGTMIPLQKVGRGTSQSERATVVSDNGKVAAGFAPDLQGEFQIDRSPAVWKDDGTGFLLTPDLADGSPGEVKAISADGKIVAGNWATSDAAKAAFGGNTGFTWSEETGVVRFSSATPASDQLIVNAMSTDAKFVYGKLTHFQDPTDFFSPSEYYAFVWNKDKGLRNLQDVATAAGITVPANHFLTNIMAVSGDGRVVIGDAEVPPDDPNTGSSTPKLFVLVLPEGAL